MFLAIVNPVSGGGRAGRLAKEFLKYSKEVCRHLSIEHTSVDVIETDAQSRWVSDLRERLRRNGTATVVVFGGDGTLSQAACAVHGTGTKPTLLFVPGGRGNDFLRALYERSFGETSFWSWFFSSKWATSNLDIASCNEHFFLNMASIGYGGQVVENVHERKALWSNTGAVYQVEGALALLSERENDGVVHLVDSSGAKIDFYSGPVFGIFAGNGCANGGGLYWLPEAKCDDGELDLCVFRKPGVLGMMRALGEVKAKKTLSIFHKKGRASEIDIRFENPVAVELDGEYKGRSTRFRFKTVPRAIAVYRNSAKYSP